MVRSDYEESHKSCMVAPVRLQQDSWAQVLVLVPPVGGARGGAAGAEDALVQAVQLGARRLALEVLLLLAEGSARDTG